MSNLASAIDELAAGELFSLSDADLETRLVHINQSIARLQGEFCRTLRVFDARQG